MSDTPCDFMKISVFSQQVEYALHVFSENRLFSYFSSIEWTAFDV